LLWRALASDGFFKVGETFNEKEGSDVGNVEMSSNAASSRLRPSREDLSKIKDGP
jgi:hypothetical protein